MKICKALLFIFVSSLLASCAKRQVVETFPQHINEDTGLREIKLRRSNCIATEYEHLNSRCSATENVIVSADSQNDKDHIQVQETTRWLNAKGKVTVVEPTIQIDEQNEKMIIKVKHRLSLDSTSQNFQETLHIFEGDLRKFRADYKKSKDNKYLYLVKKNSGSEFLRSLIYCVDAPLCHNVYVLFSFVTLDDEGNEKIDSRTFNIDQRELPLADTDFIPGRAVVTQSNIKMANVDLPKIEANPPARDADEDEVADAEENLSGLEDMQNPEAAALYEEPLGPVLPKEVSDYLCQGFKDNICPDYIFNPSLKNNTLTPDDINDMLGISRTAGFNRSTIEAMQEAFGEEGFKVENQDDENPDDLPRQTDDNHAVEATEESKEELSKEESEEKPEPELKLPTENIPRPVPRPEHLDTTLKEQENNFESLPETNVPLPTPRPDFSAEGNFVEQQDRESNIKDRYMESVDGKFTYDLALCEDRLLSLRNDKFNQSKYFYSKDGRLNNASRFNAEFDLLLPRKDRQEKQYGSDLSFKVLNFSACVLEQRYGSDVSIDVHDFSHKNGGGIQGHVSHRNGLDVDVSYPHLKGKTKGFDNFHATKDKERIGLAIDYGRILVATQRVHILFSTTTIKEMFCSYLQDIGKLSEHQEFVEEMLYHVANHHHHYHIRMTCNEQNAECTAQGQLPKTSCM